VFLGYIACLILHLLIVGTLYLCPNTPDLLPFCQCLAGIINVAAHHVRF